jgi:acetyltransferase-like isoleucine patch superfamily enzyme
MTTDARVHQQEERRRPWLKAVGEGLAGCLVMPLELVYRLRLLSYGSAGQTLALVPGYVGVLLRRAWYSRTLAGCGRNLVVDFMTVILRPDTRVGNNCYINAFCWIGWADIGDDFLGGDNITILSGNRQHGFDSCELPMRLQEGEKRLVRIGRDVWCGSRVAISADVAEGSILASGAVVTKTYAPYSILAGVPARLLRARPDAPVQADVAAAPNDCVRSST